MPDQLQNVLEWIQTHEGSSIDALLDWLRIPSVSTDPGYAHHVRHAAHWAADHLSASGLTARLVETGTPRVPGDATTNDGHPIVLATHNSSNPAAPHILFYGHYDVQPADPLELWDSPPFEPTITDTPQGKAIIARGASDDKGQVMTFLTALRAWKEAAGRTAADCNLTVMLEGEEESGSKNLEAFLRDHGDLLGSPVCCLISDTAMLSRGMPAITTGVRGLTYTEITLTGPNKDLHSGMWGGRCPNPLNELIKVLAQLWDEQRRVTLPGFYDNVLPPSDEERAAWSALPFDQHRALKDIGLPPQADVGEAGFSALEREWARPTCDINGIFGGYTGDGAKTIIPSKATAKLSFRLVADQRQHDVLGSLRTWLEQRTPPGCAWTIKDLGGGEPALTPTDSPAVQAVNHAVRSITGHTPDLIRTGGSIPVAGMLKSIRGIDTLFLGFALDDDRVHSPNEKFELDCFRLGCRTHAALLPLLAQLEPHTSLPTEPA